MSDEIRDFDPVLLKEKPEQAGYVVDIFDQKGTVMAEVLWDGAEFGAQYIPVDQIMLDRAKMTEPNG